MPRFGARFAYDSFPNWHFGAIGARFGADLFPNRDLFAVGEHQNAILFPNRRNAATGEHHRATAFPNRHQKAKRALKSRDFVPVCLFVCFFNHLQYFLEIFRVLLKFQVIYVYDEFFAVFVALDPLFIPVIQTLKVIYPYA